MHSFFKSVASRVDSLLTGLSTKSTVSLQHEQYTVQQVLGEGGFSYVYLVKHAKDGKLFALKKVKCSFGKESLKKAMREVEAYSRFSNKNLMQLITYELNENEGHKAVFMLLPHYARGSLQEMIDTCRTRNSQIPESRIVLWCRGILNGLQALHNGYSGKRFMHMDLKPGNMLLCDNMHDVVLGDFGSLSESPRLLQTHPQVLAFQDEVEENCTMAFRAPELFNIHRDMTITEKIDIWSFGCVLYSLMYLIGPFERYQMEQGGSLALAISKGSYNIPETPEYDQKLHNVLNVCLTKNVESRPSVPELLPFFD
ncbi:NAK protein kinase Ppk13 [Schizosaccharomyces japonicus yFS275]|uniref:non-specific serine/threonine protein kinase n=1 Tax=Schizosaccharomyces japonicus (strain yFS275 / FY16936) TaxID=402676 RepID=B6K436_SCHJY|nr:NAK protein kinase Ppk13 [Schizosaccharomyces japonicus yFS275]EEB08243.1 NAK protein kinase Ppk13 [Schizosaccharomyces japonicus yFS275]